MSYRDPFSKPINGIDQSGASAENCVTATQINFNIIVTKDLDSESILKLVEKIKTGMKDSHLIMI